MNDEDKKYMEAVNKEIALMNEYLIIENRRKKLINKIMSSKCTHLFQGENVLVPTDNGGVKCNICGRSFYINNARR